MVTTARRCRRPSAHCSGHRRAAATRRAAFVGGSCPRPNEYHLHSQGEAGHHTCVEDSDQVQCGGIRLTWSLPARRLQYRVLRGGQTGAYTTSARSALRAQDRCSCHGSARRVAARPAAARPWGTPPGPRPARTSGRRWRTRSSSLPRLLGGASSSCTRIWLCRWIRCTTRPCTTSSSTTTAPSGRRPSPCRPRPPLRPRSPVAPLRGARRASGVPGSLASPPAAARAPRTFPGAPRSGCVTSGLRSSGGSATPRTPSASPCGTSTTRSCWAWWTACTSWPATWALRPGRAAASTCPPGAR
mmetsp:Transcript_41530/g.119125  ORF Transcript_41530/g.119125 Transcript_41530/m.119125 type:complete len:301 (+) Transcript_41530:28-930(+)